VTGVIDRLGTEVKLMNPQFDNKVELSLAQSPPICHPAKTASTDLIRIVVRSRSFVRGPVTIYLSAYLPSIYSFS